MPLINIKIIIHKNQPTLKAFSARYIHTESHFPYEWMSLHLTHKWMLNAFSHSNIVVLHTRTFYGSQSVAKRIHIKVSESANILHILCAWVSAANGRRPLCPSLCWFEWLRVNLIYMCDTLAYALPCRASIHSHRTLHNRCDQWICIRWAWTLTCIVRKCTFFFVTIWCVSHCRRRIPFNRIINRLTWAPVVVRELECNSGWRVSERTDSRRKMRLMHTQKSIEHTKICSEMRLKWTSG